ncbi:MAG: ABC transporter permease [Candidatus Nomurabacteria bacterium]|nr:ABC transporter permease [Candidatus Nomurabacteria bacterium]
MIKKHENYRELVLRLAKTDFKLRYHGSTLGYVWVILKPLLMFSVLNFVFSNIFGMRNSTNPYYPLELMTALLMFQFFAEGTMAGMMSLVLKAQLVTKTYVPRWTIVLGSTINSLFVFGMNLIVLTFFFFIYDKMPSFLGIIMFLIYSILLYLLIVAFSFVTAPLFVRFRDLSNIWEVLLSILMYASPIVYPLSIMPIYAQKILLLNPLAFIIHFSKQGLISNNFTGFYNFSILFFSIVFVFILSFFIFKKYEKKVAEII